MMGRASVDEEAMRRGSEIKRRMMRNFVGIEILMWEHLEEAKKNPRCFSYYFIDIDITFNFYLACSLPMQNNGIGERNTGYFMAFLLW